MPKKEQPVDDREAKVAAAMSSLNEKYGVNSVVKMDENHKFEVESFPTNCANLDYVLACGGLPRGRIVQIAGAPSSGKSSLALYISGQVQAAGGLVVWVDAEAVFEKARAEAMGVDTTKLVVSSPTYGEEALDIIEKMSAAGVDLIVIDSISAMVPKAELEGEMEDQTIALQARMLSKGLRKVTAALSKSNTTVLAINQLREIINAYGHGPKKVSSGGQALRFYCSIMLESSKVKTLKVGEKVVGHTMKISASKNKCGQPMRSSEINYMYEGKQGGFDFLGGALDLAEELKVVTRTGNTIYFGEDKLGVGTEGAKKVLAADAKLEGEFRKALYKAIG